MIEIKDIKGQVLHSLGCIPKGCKRKFELMKEDFIQLRFSLAKPVTFGLGCYTLYEGQRYEVTSLQTPVYNAKTSGYDYELRLDAYYWKWKNKIFKYTPESAGQEAAWNLTAPLEVHLGILIRNLRTLGYRYGTHDFTFSIDASVENKAKMMAYDNISILDALFSMAKQWECECWVADNVINFGRLENGTAVKMEIGKNVESMTRSESQADYATRIYAFGSMRNLPANYRATESSLTVNGVVQKRLMLPAGTPYIDAVPNMSTEEAVEQVIVLDDIYPRTNCVVGEVKSYTSNVKDEESGATVSETYYYMTDTSGLVFKEEYRLEGEDLKVIFQKGALNGMEFVCNFRPAGTYLGGVMLTADAYELIVNDSYGRQLPDAVLKPATGDEFVLVGWDSTKLPAMGLVDKAEQELKDAVVKKMEKMKMDPSVYTCSMMSSDVYQANGLHVIYEAGQRVDLVNPAYFATSRKSRIIGFELKLDRIYDSPVYTVGEAASYSRIGELEEQVEELTLNGQTYTGGYGSGVYLITSFDQTPPTEKNTFSAKRLIRELAKLLRKDSPDSTAYLLKLLGGAEVGKAIDSFVSGKGIVLDKNGRIQTDSIEIRQSMKVMELIINRLQGMENDFTFSPTRKVLRVESIDITTYKLFLDPKMDGDVIPFRDGNIVYSIVNDLLTGGNNYYTSYCRVLTTNQNDYSITVSLYPDGEVPGGKNYIPVAGYNVSRRGHANLLANKNDAQSWYLSSSEGRLLFLQNVIKPLLEDYNFALSVGKFPRIKAVEDLHIGEDEVGIMAQTIVAQHIHKFDYNGDIVPEIVDRGAWSLATAQSDKPYRRVALETHRPNGTTYTLLEQHAVWNYGCRWGCLVDKTIEEPSWNAQGWQLIDGNPQFSLDFDSSAGWAFFRTNVDTTITALVSHVHEDITDKLMAAAGTEVVWQRDSGNIPADNSWLPTYVDGKKNVIRLTNADMPSEFCITMRKLRFTCEVFVPDGIAPIAKGVIDF